MYIEGGGGNFLQKISPTLFKGFRPYRIPLKAIPPTKQNSLDEIHSGCFANDKPKTERTPSVRPPQFMT